MIRRVFTSLIRENPPKLRHPWSIFEIAPEQPYDPGGVRTVGGCSS